MIGFDFEFSIIFDKKLFKISMFLLILIESLISSIVVKQVKKGLKLSISLKKMKLKIT